MRLEELEEFIVLSRYLNYRKAADKLNVTQPTLSKHILSLESELGFDLFKRGTTLSLTAAGMRYLRYAQEAVNTLSKAAVECKALTRQASSVRVQWFDDGSIAERLLNEVKATTGLSIEYVENTDASLLELLKNDIADVVLFYDVEGTKRGQEIHDAGIESLCIGSVDIAIAVTEGGVLYGKESLRRSDLRGLGVLIPLNVLYDDMAGAFNNMLGDDLNLGYMLRTDLTHSAMRHESFADCAHISSVSRIQWTCGQRSDVKVFTELDGESIRANKCIFYRKDCANPNVQDFVACARRIVGAQACQPLR